MSTPANSINANIVGGVIQEASGGTGQGTYTTGDILYSDASNSLAKLAISSLPGAYLHYDSSNVSWFTPTSYSFLMDEFMSQGGQGNINWRATNSGTGSGFQVNEIIANNHPGTLRFSTGTTTTGNSIINLFDNSSNRPVILGGAEITVQFIIKIETLSDGTDTFAVRLGLSTNTGGGNMNDSVYFEYTTTGSTPNWMRGTAVGGVRTLTSTGIAASTNWVKLMFKINAAGSSVDFFIDDISAGTNNTNMPTGSLGPLCFILKSAGTNDRKLHVDHFYMYQKFTTPR